VVATAAGGDKAAIDAELRVAVQKLDRAAAKGVIHKNAAARKKSRLSAMLKKAKATAGAK
jgi:small subunit ribosomal protein S20